MKSLYCNFFRKEKGAITIWVTMLSVGMIMVVLFVIECIRIEHAESLCNENINIAILSAMSDYEPDIYNNYHMFALDECYGSYNEKESVLKNTILRYANMSINPSYIDDKASDIMGCSVNNVKIVNKKYFDNYNLINQISSYIEASQNRKKEALKYKEKYSMTKEKSYLCTYIMNHFSSYKNLFVLAYMNKENIYEIEFLISGENTDNKNISKIMKQINKDYLDSEKKDIVCSDEQYKELLLEKLSGVSNEILCERIITLIINNINATFNKNISKKNLLVGVNVDIEYIVETRTLKLLLVNKMTNMLYDNYKINCKKKFCY